MNTSKQISRAIATRIIPVLSDLVGDIALEIGGSDPFTHEDIAAEIIWQLCSLLSLSDVVDEPGEPPLLAFHQLTADHSRSFLKDLRQRRKAAKKLDKARFDRVLDLPGATDLLTKRQNGGEG